MLNNLQLKIYSFYLFMNDSEVLIVTPIMRNRYGSYRYVYIYMNR